VSTQFTLNGTLVTSMSGPMTRLTQVLRDELGYTGTKVGCDAGDCGACTVIIDGEQACACLLPLSQVEGAVIDTVEGLGTADGLDRLQRSFRAHGAAQCGICTPGMLMAATSLLRSTDTPTPHQVRDAIGGVLCRCTGYQAIVEAILEAAAHADDPQLVARIDGLREESTEAPYVGQSIARVEVAGKLTGAERYGADRAPDDALWMKVVRSPYAHARFELGDFADLYERFPGLVRVLTATDVPGVNGFGIYTDIKDQPVLAPGVARFRGEAVALLVGEAPSIEQICDDDLAIEWTPLPPLADVRAALAEGAPRIHADKPDNILIEGRVLTERDGIDVAVAEEVEESCEVFTPFVEHAYIEPEAGYARRIDSQRIEIAASTQTPYMDRDEVANVLGIDPEQVRINPTACGGGFGGKLDQSVQPLLAVAAWVLGRPVRTVFTRTESMASTTKRHPARITASASASGDGVLTRLHFRGDFDTGAYASWGPTVAGRVPVHCTGPYRVPNVDAQARAIYTHNPPAGAFRGFGVPQAAIAHEALMDQLAERLAIDPLQFRLDNAIRVGDTTATGQRLEASAGLASCIEALRPGWTRLRESACDFNALRTGGRSGTRDAEQAQLRRGVGIACMWYGCGNTSLSNPSTMRVTVDNSGQVTFFNGAQEIGQGSSTVMLQILSDVIGVAPRRITVVGPDTDLTHDAGKSSASRQTFVSGRATEFAGRELRSQIMRSANAGESAMIEWHRAMLVVVDGAERREVDLRQLPANAEGYVFDATATYDPPTTPLDENGQGIPYATFGFAAQVASVVVDVGLGTVKVDEIIAAHDVGRAINPRLIEGQVHGGIAQGLGLALMEEYIPGRTENLHDYLIPTVGDMPRIETIIIEDPEPHGPFGAKGIGEPALVPTAPAILGAVAHATGVRLTEIPILPHRVLAALEAARIEEK
jgi:CO/xanthine dehydrogenase Mo-binding subunit/aerobic-type carbon monoxide dehydrogenase small subunit (CoxS/CutS family)